MYYSFPCTYCHRVFYTYDTDKHRAARTLYRTIKQHLIDYDEDKKEYDLDDGERMDTDQIYAEMKASNHQPTGGYHATKTTSVIHPSTKKESSVSHSSHATHKKSSSDSFLNMLIFLLVILIGIMSLFFFLPDMFKLELPQLAF